MTAKLVLDASSYKTGMDLAKQLTTNVNKEMELWKVQNNEVEGSLKALLRQSSANSDTQKLLTSEIDITQKKLKEVTAAQGEDSTAAIKLKNSLLDLQIQQAKLSNEIGGGLTPLQNFKNNLVSVGEQIQKTGEKIMSAGSTITKSITVPILAAGAGILKLANDSAEYADAIGVAAEKTGMSTDSIQELKFAANQLDIDFEKVQGSMTAFTNRLKGLEDGSGDTVESIKKLGIATTDSAGKTRAISDIYSDAISKLSDMTNESDRNIMAAKVFGKSWSEIAPMLNAGGTEIQRLKDQAQSLGLVMSEDALNQAREYGDQMDALKIQFQVAGAEIGASFMPLLQDSLVPFIKNSVVPAVKSIVEGVTDLIAWFKNLSPTTQTIIGAMVGLLAALGPIITVVGGIVTGIGMLAPVLAALTGPVGLVIVAVAALVAGIIYLWKTNESFRDAMIAVWEAIKTAAETIFNAIKAFWSEWGGTITQMFSDAWEIIKTVATTIFTSLKAFWETWGGAITAYFSALWDGIKTIVSGVWEGIKNIVTTALTIVSNVIGLMLDVLKGDWSGAWEHIQNITQAAWDYLVESINIFKDTFINIWENIKDGVMNVVDNLLSGIKKVISYVTDALESIGILNDTKIEDKTYTVTKIVNTVNSSSEGTGGGNSGGTSSGGGGNGSVGAFAEGTTNAPKGWAWTGERGPELIKFNGGERVIPNNKLGGDTFNVTISGNQISSDYDINRIGEQFVSYLKSKGVKLATPY